jgi:hypothetical protein
MGLWEELPIVDMEEWDGMTIVLNQWPQPKKLCHYQ